MFVVVLFHFISLTLGVGLLVTASIVIHDIKDPQWVNCISADCKLQQEGWVVAAAFSIISSMFAMAGYFDILLTMDYKKKFDFEILSLNLRPMNRMAVARATLLFAAFVGAVAFFIEISNVGFLSHLRSLKGENREYYFVHAKVLLVMSGMIPGLVFGIVSMFYAYGFIRRSCGQENGQRQRQVVRRREPARVRHVAIEEEASLSDPPPYASVANKN